MPGRMMQLSVFDDMTVCTLWRTDVPNSRVQVRGRPGYTGDGYDSKDPLAVFLDGFPRSCANFSDLWAFVPMSLNPKNPGYDQGKTWFDKYYDDGV